MKLPACISSSILPLLAGIAALALLVAMIATSPSRLCYDEPYQIDLAKNVIASGWIAALTSPNNECVVGPLYSATQIAAYPLTGFQPPAIRWINFICLVLVLFILAKTNQRRAAGPDWASAFAILSVPFLWPSAGMALTELPALLAFTCFVQLMLFQLGQMDEDISIKSIGLAIFSGLLLGLAILGRQTYLVVIPAILALFLIAPKKWLHWLVCLGVAISSSCWLFVMWHGLIPPAPSQQVVEAGGIQFGHGFLAVSYVAAATFFLNPAWFKTTSHKLSVIFLLLGIGFAMLMFNKEHLPASAILLKIFGDRGRLLVGILILTAMSTLALVWFWNTILMAWNERHDRGRAFLYLTLFALVAVPMKVSHIFSSRYVVGLLGVLVLVVGNPRGSGAMLALRIALGSLMGAACLWTYYITK